MKGVIYLLSGKICSGKDYVANILVKYKNFKRYAFADELKNEVSREYLIDRDLLDTQYGKACLFKNGKTYRTLMIEHAHNSKRNNKNYYTDKLINHIKSNNDKQIAISDFRYPYEYSRIVEALRDTHDILTVNVDRKYCLRLDIESEMALEDFEYDLLLDNNGDEHHVLSQFYDFIWKRKPALAYR
jgi:dephospho-CoA kinase